MGIEQQKFANNAATVLSGSITNVATSINVVNGAVFPSLATGEYFYATLIGYDSNGNENTWEIVKVTARSVNLLTVVRGQDGTSAVAWPSAARIELRLNAATMSDAVTKIVKETGTQYTLDADGNKSGTWAIDYTNGPVISATASGNITSITVSDWPASGTAGHLKLICTNFGAYTITFPSSWKFVKPDLTLGTFTDTGLTLPPSGVVIIDLITIDGGTNVYAFI